MVGWYHICDHSCYVPMVLADHSKNNMVGLYHVCDYCCYLHVVPADHSKKVQSAGTIFVTTHAMYLWYKLTVLFLLWLAGTIFVLHICSIG
jgi:hypothetical protein